MIIDKDNYIKTLRENYKRHFVAINGKKTELLTNHLFDIIKYLNLDTIAINAGLTDKMHPLCVVQYFEENGVNLPEPVIAFIWSWDGPWAYIHYINHPEKDTTDIVALELLESTAKVRLFQPIKQDARAFHKAV
jgi:hypothetical protein